MQGKDVLPVPPPEASAMAAVTLRQRAEARFIENTDLAQGAPLSALATQTLMHELQVHQIELEMENGELRRTEAALDAARARFFDFYDLAPMGYMTVNGKGLISQANLSTAAMLGLPRGELMKQPISRFILGYDQDIYYHFRRKLVDSGASLTCELRLVKPDGASFWVEIAGLALPNEQGEPALRLVLSDISLRKKAQQQVTAGQALLVEALEHSQAIQDNMVDGVVSIDAHGLIQSFNKAACRIFGYAPDEVLGHNVSLLMPEPQRSAHDGYLQHFRATGQTHILGKAQFVSGQRKDGRVFPLSLSVSQITRDGQNTFVGIRDDISEQQANAEAIARLAFYDPLTGLPNRRLLLDRVQQALLNSSRNGLHGALMFLDLDNFKLVNDSLGHDVGDLLLQQVAERLQACVREGDSVARLSGDEFVLLLEGLSSEPHDAAAQAQASAKKILASLSQPCLLGEHRANCGASLGIVVFLGTEQSLTELLKKADIAMYQAKDAGRGTLRFYDADMQAAVLARSQRIADLKRALAQQEFVLHYQIQVNQQGAPIGVEALVRWQHATRGLVPPGDFIALAEETKLILPLGQWVLEAACAQLAAWAAQPQTALWTMSVADSTGRCNTLETA